MIKKLRAAVTLRFTAAYIFYMEFSFSQLKKMEVVSVTDGKNLGKVFDVVFHCPKGDIKGFYVTGSKGFKLTKSDMFVPLENIVKIGEDVVLVNTQAAKTKEAKTEPNRRNLDEYE